jgi:C_GCAxxG_C_C family probable redox protein
MVPIPSISFPHNISLHVIVYIKEANRIGYIERKKYIFYTIIFGGSMTEKKLPDQGRRHFIKGFSLVLLSGHLVKALQGKTEKKTNIIKLSAELTADEKKILEKSTMAREIVKNRSLGLNCAETILLTSLQYLQKPDEWFSAASGFGGGMGKREVCGLLTGGIMAIGIAGGILHKDPKVRRRFVGKKRDEYWKWWVSQSPVKCQDMRGRYDREGYLRMIQRVAFKIEELIKTAKI